MKSLLILLVLCLSINTFAGKEQFSERAQGAQLVTSGVLEVYDTKYFDMQANPGTWPSNYTNYSVNNRIKIGYMEDYFPTGAVYETTTIELKVEYWTYVGSAFVLNTVTKFLTLDYDPVNPGNPISELSTFAFTGGHRARVTINSISGNTQNIFLENEIDIERYYAMSVFTVPSVGYNAINYSSGALGLEPTLLPGTALYDPRIGFWWTPVKGAEEYELEWTFVSNYDVSVSGGISTTIEVSAANLQYDFYKNATRVRVTDNYYEIPAIFNRGYIVYRVRPIGRQGANFEYRLEGDWSSPESNNIVGFISSNPNGAIKIGKDFEYNKNWIYSATYSEDGKRFEGIAYVDGMGRGRQSLSHNTVTNQMIVNNAYFDKVGRPVIGDLPTPMEDESFSFRREFNHLMVYNSSTGNYDDVPFTLDNYLLGAGNCALPNALSLNYGAGKYYSVNNPDKDGSNATIPNAAGYPFSKVTYMNDPTGRLREVGSAGLELQTSQHSSKMFYETVNQDELNRLFGTAVGLNSHYQKTITLDPNGQAYIAYTDMAGRTIATGLSASSPVNLDPLSNNTGGTTQTDIVYTNALDNNSDLTIAEYTYTKAILEDNSLLTLTHDFDPAVFKDLTCLEGICFDCHYDYELTIKRTDCPSVPNPVYHYSVSMSGAEIDSACNLNTFANPTNHDTIPPLSKGEYSISKKLKLSDGIAEQYWCKYVELAAESCLPNFHTIYEAYYDATDFGCHEVEVVPSELSSCDIKRKLLIHDMAVNGQYGEVYDPSTGLINVSLFPLSIYNDANQLSNTVSTSPNWRSPITPYTNHDGTPARIYVSLINGVYSPLPDNISNVQTDAGGLHYVTPEHLANLSDFVFYAEEAWGEALISYHPEYCYLTFCEANGEDFHAYSAIFDATNTFDEACANGSFAPLGSVTLPALFSSCNTSPVSPNVDHFFTAGYYASGGTVATWAAANYPCVPMMSYAANSSLTKYYQLPDGSYLNIWQYAIYQVNCAGITNYSSAISCINSTVLDDCNKELIWQNFKQAYSDLRKRTFLFAQSAYVSYPGGNPGGGCGMAFNSCIGQPFPSNPRIDCFDIYIYVNGSTTITTSMSSFEPCNKITADLYSKKHPNFINFYSDDYPVPVGVDLGDLGSVQAYYDAQIANACQTNCENQADEWMATLSSCVTPGTTQYDQIRAGFIEVCTAGCDGTNPSGASDLTNAPVTHSSPHNYTSFADVLEHVLGSGYETSSCSGLLISTPAPYGSNILQNSLETVDNCACDKVLQAKYDFAINTDPAITSIVDQLAKNEGITYSQANSLACMCAQEYETAHGTSWYPGASWNSTSQTNLANSGFQIPAGLSCNAQACHTCTEIDALRTSLLSRFGSTVVNSPNYDLLLMNYMNFNLGFNLSSEEYFTFMEACSSTTGSSTCSVSTLSTVLTDLIDVIARRGGLLQDNLDLSDNIVYTNSHIDGLFTGHTYDFEDNGSEFIIYLGDKKIRIALPSGADFTFSDILSVSGFSPLPCGESDAFEWTVTIMKCGVLETRVISGTTDDFDLVTCYCGEEQPVLCNHYLSSQVTDRCYRQELDIINSLSMDSYIAQMNAAHTTFIKSYLSTCAAAFQTETLSQTSKNNNYQFTLFYYDQAGNLFQTIAPEGVDLNFKTSPGYANVDNNRISNIVNVPTHKFITRYEYNGYDQLVTTGNPDQQGDTKYWYDRYGRIVLSQNPVHANYQYSYILYDALGRPQESGQFSRQISIFPTLQYLLPFTEDQLKKDDLGAWFKNYIYSGIRSEVTYTTYDAYDVPASITPKFVTAPNSQNLRMRVSGTRYFPSLNLGVSLVNNLSYESASYYSYDAHGNVLEHIQDVPMMSVVAQNIKSTQYSFELVSGNVKKVTYQKGSRDMYIHQYIYDKINRLTEVFTSNDEVNKARDAHYLYYDYGPLARVEIGKHKVQGQDFAYTINGWIKGMNGSVLNTGKEIGKDGAYGYLSGNPTVHNSFAKDVNAYTLGYFEGDYKPINSISFELTTAGTNFGNQGKNLYNGNIRNLVTSIFGMATTTLGSAYHYDQLNRLTEMTAFKYDAAYGNTWGPTLPTTDYYSNYTYDQNGNITHLKRNGVYSTTWSINSLYMDDINYDLVGLDGAVNALSTSKSNRLDRVTDSGANDGTFGADIKSGQVVHNYTYDKLGQLLSDTKEGIANMVWRKGDKKIQKIIRTVTDLSSPELEFYYNPLGQRIVKVTKPRVSGTVQPTNTWIWTYYAYDANGQVMATYEIINGSSIKKATLIEQPILGAGRLGLYEADLLLYDNGTIGVHPTAIYTAFSGNKSYELTNYLGNVQAVISDRKMGSTVLEAATYNNLTGVTVAGTAITRNVAGTSWNVSGGSSTQTVEQGEYFEWTLGGAGAANNQLIIAGLSYIDPDLNYTSEKYSWYTHTSGLTIFESGAMPSGTTYGSYGAYAPGKKLKIERVNNMINYYYDNILKRSVVDPQPNTPMIVDFAFCENARTIYNLQISNNDNYIAVVKSTSDYYPFGMPMPGRQSNMGNYRFGYNGMEMDNEVKTWAGTSYTTEFRQYDPRLGRWMSLDPMMMEFPDMSPYVAFDNNPVYFTDPFGLEAVNDGTGNPPIAEPTDVGQISEDGEWESYKDLGTGKFMWALLGKDLDAVVINGNLDNSCEAIFKREVYAALRSSTAWINEFFPTTLGTANDLDTPFSRISKARSNYYACMGIPEPSDNITFSSFVHGILDLVSFIPLAGDIADAANAIIYAAEGDYVAAGASGLAIIFGSSGITVPIAKKAAGEIIEGVEEKIVRDVGQGVVTRKEALRSAKEHAQVPRNSKGGRDLPMDGPEGLNRSSRGKNWAEQKANGAKKRGRENPKGKNKWEEHPDGHPDAGQQGVPEHHSRGHVHSVDQNGNKKVFPYKN